MLIFFRTFLRHLGQHWLVSVANLFGLSASFAMAYAVGVLIHDGWTSDGGWVGAGRTYIVSNAFINEGKVGPWSPTVPGPMYGLVRDNFPEIEATLRLIKTEARGSVGGNGFDSEMIIAEGNLPAIFDLPVVAGDLATAYATPHGLIISTTEAERLFGGQDAIGQVLTLLLDGRTEDYVVQAVMAPLPANSHLRFDMLAQLMPADFASSGHGQLDNWNMSGWVSTYVLLKQGTGLAAFRESFLKRLETLIPDYDGNTAYDLEPVEGLMLWSKSPHGLMQDPVERQSLFGLGLTAGMLLLAAMANHVSLRASMALRRVREMAVRRVLGGTRGRVALRLMAEEIILVALAIFIAVDGVPLLGERVGNFVGFSTSLLGADRLPALFVLGAIGMALVVISSLFPIWRLTGARTAGLLRDAQSTVTSQSGRLRFLLICAQVALGTGLSLACFGIFANVQYLMNMDKGFEVGGKLHVRGAEGEAWAAGRESFAYDLSGLDGVERVAASSNIPFINWNARMGTSHPRTGAYIEFEMVQVEPEFFGSFNLKPLAGRLLDRKFGMDMDVGNETPDSPMTQNIVISKTAADQIGYEKLDDVLGFSLKSVTRGEGGKLVNLSLVVVGVVPDINFKSGKYQSTPTIYSGDPGSMRFLTLELGKLDRQALVDQIRSRWMAQFPDQPFVYSFAEDNLIRAYGSEEELGQLLLICAVLASVVMVSGLAALARHEVITRRREVALRRVLGAGGRHIILLMFGRFGRPLVVGLLVGIPAAWYFLDDWVSAYQNHVVFSLWHMLLFAGVASGFCLALLSGEALRAVRVRPAQVLHHE
ncbi:MAG: ABC transporter permease [Alphaproteobacteria bacterium]|nr:MAG: ABC transporter permease [Alphaproteobacteria bacterium]